MNFIETNDVQNGNTIKLAYCDYGEGKPVVLIHGWPVSKEMWEYQLDALVQAGYRVIAYDRRGFGHSDKPWGNYDYDTLTDDLYAVLNELDLHDVTLVGFSMGGGEVARYFTRYGGERVTKVVLISSVVPYMPKTEDNPDGVPQEMLEKMGKQVKEDRIAFLDDFGKMFYGVNLVNHPVSAPYLDWFRMLAAVASPKATADCMKAFAYTDFRNDAPNINVPTLIIHGDADKTVPIETSSNHTAQLVPNNQYLVYEGAPHGLFYTERERLNKDLVEFISTGTVGNYDTASVDTNSYVAPV